jgi:hypothetical protein
VKKDWNLAWEFNMKPPSPQIGTTFFSRWKRQVVATNGNPAPIVVKKLSRSNVLSSYAYIHTLFTYHPISAFQFFPFLVHPTILIKNLWLKNPQKNDWCQALQCKCDWEPLKTSSPQHILENKHCNILQSKPWTFLKTQKETNLLEGNPFLMMTHDGKIFVLERKL